MAFGTSWGVLLPFVWSNGGDWFDEEDREVLIDQPESVEALQNPADLIYRHRVAPTPTQMESLPAYNILLQTQRVAMVIDGQWALLDLAKSRFNLGVAPLPIYKEPVALKLGAPNVIFAQTKHPEEAWLLYKWTTTASSVMPLIQQGLWMPLQVEYYTDPEKMQEWLTRGSPSAEYKEAVIDYLLEYGRAAPSYYIRNWPEISRTIMIAESTFNVFFKLNYQKTYDAVLATPLGPGDVALGEIGWAVIRSTLYALGFMVVIFVLGLRDVAVGGVRRAGGDPARVRLRGGRHGRDDVHAVVAGLRPDPARGAAAVPVQRHVLPDHGYPPALQLFVQLTPLYQGVT